MDTFQETVFKLKKYWADRGCIIQEPYDTEVGAGTMAPETFLRVLGKKKYNVAYVQPSRRPADGRYGDNPNRLYKNMQMQVILKPTPADVLDLYMGSLEAIGIDLSKVQLTHHALKKRSTDSLPLLPGLGDPLQPIKNSGAGLVREREKALMDELIERVNELFSGELTDDDKLVYVQQVLGAKMLESRTLQQQARNNTKEQFGSSPDLMTTLNDAIIDAYDAHKTMSQQALNSKELQAGLLRILLDYGNLYDKLRARAV